jgi:hypothetical protein
MALLEFSLARVDRQNQTPRLFEFSKTSSEGTRRVAMNQEMVALTLTRHCLFQNQVSLLSLSLLEFNLQKGGFKKKAGSNKTQQTKKGAPKSHSMVKVNPFMHSDIHSKISEDNINSHSSMSLEGYEMVLNLKESLRDFEALIPEKSPLIRLHNLNDNFRWQKSNSKKHLQDERQLLSS